MEKGRGKETDTLQTDNVFTRKEYIEREAAIAFMNEVEPCICHDPDGAVFTATKDSNMLEFLRAIPAADVVARDCFDKILAENDDMRAIIDTYGGLDNIQSAFVKLHEIETADVVPVRHGVWVDEGRMRHCSVCGRRKYFKENYCPNCGARMDGDGE